MKEREYSKWGIVYCPKTSFAMSPAKRWARIERILKEQGVEYDYVQSENSGSVDRLVKMMINNGYKTIVLVGGDSALNDAVNCLMQTEMETRDQIALGIIPNGLMNDFAHFWNFKEGEYQKNIEWIRQRRIRKIDLGCIRYNNKNGEGCHRYFLNCVNVGYIAAIMNLKRKTHHIFGSRTLSFVFSFLLLLFQRMDYKMSIRLNNDKIKRKVMTVCVGNCHGYGQTPNAVPYNGMLDVSVVYHPEMTQLFEGIYLFLRGKFLNHKSVHPYRTQEVVFESTQNAMVGIDGRLMNTPVGQFRITVEQEVLNLIIPSWKAY